MELLELKNKVFSIFDTDSEHLGQKLMETVEVGDCARYDAFVEAVDGDLEKDWLQMIYQYDHADRKSLMQDYTPKSLAEFMGLLCDGDTVVDLCAGSGALTIQKWVQKPKTKFRLYELDRNVIPYLLFNLAVRNISSSVCRADVLQDFVYEQWVVQKGEKYGRVISLESAV